MRISDWSSDVCSSDLLIGTVSSAAKRMVRVALVLAVLAIWEILPALGLVDPFFTSRPSLILARLWDWLSSGALAGHVRSEERRVGTEGGSTCRSWWSTFN